MNPKSREELVSAVAAPPKEEAAPPPALAGETRPGEVLFPDDGGFEKARTAVWNLDQCGMPAVIVKCARATDVAAAIAYAKTNSLKICVHTAGAHSGHAVVTGAVVVDLSLLRGVVVDPSAKTANVAGGATIGDVDAATKPHGLALPMGHVHHTGVAGMALNSTSGVGYLCRTRGLTVSYLKAVTMVTADGSVKTVSETENPELLWAVRGSGSNFGIALEMVFDLSVISPKIYCGDLVKFGKGTGPGKFLWCINSKQTREELVMKWFDFFSDETTPDECSSLLVLTPQNGPVVSRITYIPSEADSGLPEAEILAKGKEAFRPLAEYGYTLANSTKVDGYHDGLQKMAAFEPSHFYQKGVLAADFPPEKFPSVVDELCSLVEACPVNNMGSGVITMPLAGALKRTKDGTTATGSCLKTTKWWIIIIAEFPKGKANPGVRDECVRWVKDVYKLLGPFAVRDEGRKPDKDFEVYGDLYGSQELVDRLRALKTQHDPENVFSLNRNIAPN